MGQLQTSRKCGVCGRRTLHSRSCTSNLLCLLLSVLTLGIFVPVWLLLKVLEAFRPWRCQTCGQGRMV